MQFDKIYSNGCSFMWGHHHNNPWYFKYFEETKDIDIQDFLDECLLHRHKMENTQYTNPNVFKPFNQFDWVREKYNYASRVAEYFNVPIINESIFGGSLHRVIRKTLKYIIETPDEELKSTLFILEIPPPGRQEMYFCNQPEGARYCNFTQSEDNFDFITDENFKTTREYYKNSFEFNIDVIEEFIKLYCLINLFKTKNINYIFLQSDLGRFQIIDRNNTGRYLNYDKMVEIQNDINKHSIKFDESYDFVHWFGVEKKATFKHDCPDISFDGHNSIRGSKLIADYIINYIKN
jgi:hypothetical protein